MSEGALATYGPPGTRVSLTARWLTSGVAVLAAVAELLAGR